VERHSVHPLHPGRLLAAGADRKSGAADALGNGGHLDDLHC
jgi:hypothetical protein